MRTRFLSVDYFTSHLSAPSDQTLASQADPPVLLRLPVPPVADPPPPPRPSAEAEFRGLDLELPVSYEFDRIPPGSDAALARFLDEVLPWSYGVEDGAGFPALCLPSENFGDVETSNACFGDGTINDEKNLCLEGLDAKTVQLASKVKDAKIRSSFWPNSGEPKENEQRQGSTVITFETPETLESPLPCEEGEGILLKYPYIKIHMDNLNIIYDVIPCRHEVLQMIYSIDDLSTQYDVDYSTSHMEVNKMVKDRKLTYQNKIWNYEVAEVELEGISSPPWEEYFHFLLSNIEPHQCTNSDFEVDIGRKLEFEVIDILQYLLEEAPPENFLAPPLISLISLLEFDFMSLPNKRESNGLTLPLPVTVHFDEVGIFDLERFQTFEDAASSLEASEQIQGEDMHFADCVYDNLVNAELALMDEIFMSFPVPAICDTIEMSSISSFLCLIIADLKEHSASACDEIYLDWHLLQEDTCNHYIQTTCCNILTELATYESTLSPESDEIELLDFILHDNSREKRESKELNNKLSEAVSMVNDTNTKIQEIHLSKDKQKTEKMTTIVSVNPCKSSLNLDSISQSSDLSFFLSARKCSNGKNSVDDMEDSRNQAVMLPVVPDPILVYDSPEQKCLSLDIKVHQVKLCQDILDLVDHMGKCYLSILKNDTELTNNDIFQGDLELLSLPKQVMMDLIREKLLTSSFEDKTLMAYIGLYVIKQMAYYICFYGIDSCHQYMEHICHYFKSSMIRLRPLKSMIKDAHLKAENKIIEYHPSLSAFEKILQSASFRGKTKLIIAEKVFWWSLCRKLTVMGISFHKVKDSAIRSKQLDSTNHSEVAEEALKHSNCLLLSHEHISVSFPFGKFGLVMEYGGAHGSSRIHTISSELPALACIHFVKVELDELSVPSALCEGSNIFLHRKVKMESSFQPMIARKGVPNHHQLMELLDFVPILEVIGMASPHSADKENVSRLHESSQAPFSDKREQFINEPLPSSPDTIVIVNTRNSDKEMLISRRSSYQKILRMEKEGVHVVEREYDLPVDLIFSAGSCLVWYNVRTGTTLRSVSSCLTEYMENIATNILMSISFAFSGCTLVFEGDSSFLAAVMDLADGIYAAAASLDMSLQLCCSYSPDLTDEIILNCIKNAKILNCGLYPPMPESETMAESFLTSFPSINPLSAQAILSSIGILKDFLYWSHERRIQALVNYNIPQESISMFSALCRYGELGESKSGTTECSSVSSALDSDNSSSKMQYKRKRQNFAEDECWKCEPQNIELRSGPKNIVPKHPVIFRKPDRHDFLVQNESLVQNRGRSLSVIHGTDWNDLNSIGRGEIIDNNDSQLNNDLASRGNSRSSRRRLTFDMSDYPTFPSSAEVNCDSDILTPSKDHNNIESIRHEDHNNIESIRHEVIGCNNSAWDYEFSSMANTEVGRKAAFNKSKNVPFPCIPEFDGDMDLRSPFKKHGKLFKDNTGYGLVPGVEAFPLRLFGERAVHSFGRNLFQKRVEPSSGEKKRATAIHSDQLQQGSPWTIEFLDRIKEKTRKHQESLQSLPCNTCMDCPGSSRIGTYVKRQSPSCLDSYSYQGGTHQEKMAPWTLQKRRRPSLDLANAEKTSQPSLRSWTPLDKRARQVLSYARNGNERQSKLVWGDGNVRTLRKKYPS